MNKAEEQLKVIPGINLGCPNASTHAEHAYTKHTDTYRQDMHTQHTETQAVYIHGHIYAECAYTTYTYIDTHICRPCIHVV